MKKKLLIVELCISLLALTACSLANANGVKRSDFITVVSREDGSGTRGAFVELFKIAEKNEAGESVDYTTEEAEITNSTAVVMISIAQNVNAIGYISLGSLNDTVKALAIDGIPVTAEQVKDHSYPISRSFHLVTKSAINAASEDFIIFINSEEGQKIVEDTGYVSVGNDGSYQVSNVSGEIVISGSSSVAPVMEKLKENYLIWNPDVTIEIQQSDSTTGAISTIEGVCDIGMISRALKDSEKDKGLTEQVIALDGIAVIVNKKSAIDSITKEQVKSIYTGEIVNWDDL